MRVLVQIVVITVIVVLLLYIRQYIELKFIQSNL